MHIDFDHIDRIVAGVIGHWDYDLEPGDYDGQATVFYTTVEDVEHGRADARFGVITTERDEQVEDHATAGTATGLTALLRQLTADGADITLIEVPDNIAHQLMHYPAGVAA